MIRLRDICLTTGAFQLEGIALEIPTGQYGVLMGRTGAGKTTLLEAICGLRAVSCGRIEMNNRDVTHLRPAARGLGYVPQDRALFPTLTVRNHLAFGPTVRGWGRGAIAARVAELAEVLGIEHILDRKPHGLSGGEAQRVALGRALAARPGVLCLDEPLSALDQETRSQMYLLLAKIKSENIVTILHVTHDLAEAERLADRVFRLEGGRIVF